MKAYNLKCRNCGASLEINTEQTVAFCQYCGAKLLLDDGSTKTQTRIIDDARIKEAEVRLREIEYRHAQEEKAIDHRNKQLDLWYKSLVAWAVIFVLILILSAFADGFKGFIVLWIIGGLIYFLSTKPKQTEGLDPGPEATEASAAEYSPGPVSLNKQSLSVGTDRDPKLVWAAILVLLLILSASVDGVKVFVGLWIVGGLVYFLRTGARRTGGTAYLSRPLSANRRCGPGGRYGEPRKKWAALLLCGLFGIFGAHKFYEGKKLQGFLYLFTLGLLGIGVVVDFIILLTKPDEYYP